MKNPFNPKPWEKDPIWRRDNWQALNEKAVSVWKNVNALRSSIAAIRADAVKKMGNICPMNGPDNVANRIAELKFKAVQIGQDLAACESLLRAAEESVEFKLAEREYKPLMEAAEAKLAREEAERIAKQEAAAKLEIARVAARERALASVETDSEVMAAKAGLAEAQAGEL
jgi:hypothetical protein